jgi:hypothetical protein
MLWIQFSHKNKKMVLMGGLGIPIARTIFVPIA